MESTLVVLSYAEESRAPKDEFVFNTEHAFGVLLLHQRFNYLICKAKDLNIPIAEKVVFHRETAKEILAHEGCTNCIYLATEPHSYELPNGKRFFGTILITIIQDTFNRTAVSLNMVGPCGEEAPKAAMQAVVKTYWAALEMCDRVQPDETQTELLHMALLAFQTAFCTTVAAFASEDGDSDAAEERIVLN